MKTLEPHCYSARLTNYGHCCGYHTVLFYTPLCRASSCPTFQPPPVTYYYIIHTQSDIPITSGEKSHIPTKPGVPKFLAKTYMLSHKKDASCLEIGMLVLKVLYTPVDVCLLTATIKELVHKRGHFEMRYHTLKALR